MAARSVSRLGEDLGGILTLLLMASSTIASGPSMPPQALDPLEVGLGVGQRGGDHLGGVGSASHRSGGGLLGSSTIQARRDLGVDHRGNGGRRCVGVVRSQRKSVLRRESTAGTCEEHRRADSVTRQPVLTVINSLSLTPAQCPGPGRAAPRAPRVSPGPARCQVDR